MSWLPIASAGLRHNSEEPSEGEELVKIKLCVETPEWRGYSGQSVLVLSPWSFERASAEKWSQTQQAASSALE
jgi:hypothetical protein